MTPTAHREQIIRQAFLDQAEVCGTLGSPFNARVCRLVAARLEVGLSVADRILNWPGDPSGRADALPLRLAGAFHALVLNGDDVALAACYPPHQVDDDRLWDACRQALKTHQDFMQRRLDSAPQTNEVRRSAALMPGFLTVAALFSKPLVLSEIGSSAGLNLQWDRYFYQLGGMNWGDPNSTVHIVPDWSGPPPSMADVKVIERAGCDLNPLDPSSPLDRLRMLSFVWPDQADRLERTSHALDIAHKNQLKIDREDAGAWLKRRLETRYQGASHVIFHSIAWQYLPRDVQAECQRMIEEAGRAARRDTSVTWLKMEADHISDGAAITLTVWPGGETHVIGRADFHGRWIKWSGWPGRAL